MISIFIQVITPLLSGPKKRDTHRACPVFRVRSEWSGVFDLNLLNQKLPTLLNSSDKEASLRLQYGHGEGDTPQIRSGEKLSVPFLLV